jgi:dipeptidyl aminopeptidase/acylaminoacyl peptidase
MKSFLYWAAIGIAALPQTRANSQDHPFTVKDDIAMMRFSDPLPEPNIPGSEIAKPSPDREHVAVVTTRGLLDSDQIESDISIFDLKDVAVFLNNPAAQPPKPRVIAKIASFPHREETNAYAPVITDLSWSPDGMSVYFKGEHSKGAYQIYVAKLDGSGFHALTPANESIGRFDVVSGTIVYTASQPDQDHVAPGEEINPDARVVTGYLIRDVLFPDQLATIAPETYTMSVLRATDNQWITRQVPGYSVREIPYLSHFFPFGLSPNGGQLIALTPTTAVPDLWERYDPIKGFEQLRLTRRDDPRLTKTDNILRPQQYSLIDLASGRSVPLFGAPNARSLGYTLDNSRLAWAADEQRVLATNTFLRLDEGTRSDASERTRPCAVASVDLPALRVRCLFFSETISQPVGTHIQDVAFGASNDEALVLLRHGSREQTIERYHLQNDQWSLISSGLISTVTDRLQALDVKDSAQIDSVKIFIKQNLNDPPTLWVSDRETGTARQLWDPNPQFNHIRFGDASVYRWNDKTGREWNGVLVKPVDYVPGKRYPLVVQMYSFVDGEFLTDGLYPTAFAARHLASAGFVVLQIKKKPNKMSEADPQDHLEGYRSAIESLDKAGLIDRSKVGVVGFSWTCWYVVNALIKEPGLFAAATIADGLDNSYMQYILFAVGSYPLQRQMEKIRDTSPFGDGLNRWVEDAPGFHLDRVKAPVRIEAIGPSSVLQEWELYSSLHIQNKPVDLIYFPNGTHIHQKPLERLESQQGDVDWFRFWLQSYEDPDPSKRSQYDRWRKLKSELQNDPRLVENERKGQQ